MKKYWDGLVKEIKTDEFNKFKLSYPLLINVFPDYIKVDKKILVIGQQTHGWGWKGQEYFNRSKENNNDKVEDLMKSYKNFELGKYVNSPFWSAARYLYEKINLNNLELGFVWNNLIKIDDRGNKPKKEIEDLVIEKFPVLIEEIEILTPDVVVFFVGPNYKSLLQKVFTGVKILTLDKYHKKMLAKLDHSRLPQKSYIIYHPKYLRLSGNFYKVLDEIINQVKK